MKKRFFSMLLVLCMVMTLLPMTAMAVDTATVTSISPIFGSKAGGTSVTITGTGFTGANTVKFGTVAATSFIVNSDTQITATSPAGSGTVDVTVTTSANSSAPGETSKFSYVNTAPTLSGGPVALPGTHEDTTSAGTLVSTILAGLTSQDMDGDPLGIAIIGLTGTGTWQYSTDGITWNNVGKVSGTSATLLSPNTQIRYIPDGKNGETAIFTFRAWDQTIGSASTNFVRCTADTSTNGGTSIFSTGTAIARLTVSSVNDAPVLTPATPTLVSILANAVNNSGQIVSSFIGSSITDVDTGAIGGIAIVSTVNGNGTWQYSLNDGTSWHDVGTVSQTSALLLRPSDRVRFVPNGADATTASITYRAWDHSGTTANQQGCKSDTTTSGGTSAFSLATDTASIMVAVSVVGDVFTKAIAGVTVPVAGAVPTATIADATEYTATISWLPADATFKGSTVYTATITITPKAGYTLTGVPANFFTVDGATATNAADSGIVTAVFPETVPGVPTGVSAVSGNGQATVSFTAPSNNGGSAITGYTVTSSPGGFTGTGTTSPITVSGLTNGTAYTFTVTATNAAGTGAVSSASNSVTPQAQVAPTAAVQPITGTLQVGATLTGHYTYSDVNGDLEGTSTYKWYRSDNAAGLNKTAIGGAISITYVLQNAETGKYISFEVTSVAATGISPGTAVESALVGAVTPPPPSVGGGSVTPPTPLTEIKNGGSTTGTNLSQLISGGKTLTVDGDKGEKIVFDTEALKGIAGQASGDIKVEMKDVSSTHQESLPGKQVFSLTVSSGSSTITNFGGAVTITLPYTLKDGETAEDVTVWYLADDGTMTEIPCTFDPATKLATFTVTHFSLYVVGVNAPWVNPFTDVSENDWFYGAVEFANRNGLFAGTGAATFSPNSPMTRAMLWTVLGRLDGQSLSGSAVFDTARVWAMGAGITDGTNPDGSITREQMVTILWRYAGLPKAGGDLSKFSDAGSVANYAADAMAWAVENGIIAGANGALMPQDNATRTQMAAILQRFIKVAAK